MRICLDARGIRQVRSGHGRYEQELITALAEIDKTNEYLVLLRKSFSQTVISQDNFREIRIGGSQPSLSNLALGARRVGELKVDIFHSLHQFLPYGIGGLTVVTLHDLFRIEHPELVHSGFWARLYTRGVQFRDNRAIPYSLNRADHIISVSQHSADRAKITLGIDPSKMSVVPHGVSQRFLRAGKEIDDHKSDNTDVADINDHPPYFLMVGNSTKHKNVGRAVEAMGIIKERFPEVGLWVVGDGSEYRRLAKQVSRLGLRSRVRLISQVPEEELIALFQGALGLVFPSLMEGFGIPILEAQALGCPVIASDNGAPAEVAGTAAILVDPNSTASIAAAMSRIASEPQLRESLRKSGLQKASSYTWQRAARDTLRVYHSLVDGSASEGSQPVRDSVESVAMSHRYGLTEVLEND